MMALALKFAPWLLTLACLGWVVTLSTEAPSALLQLRSVMANIAASTPPIMVHGQRFEWIGPRTLQSTSDGSTWTRTCALVLTSRGALTDDGGYIGLTAIVISGPLKGATFDPRFQIQDMVPQERAGSVIQYEVPAWVKDKDLDGLLTFNMVQRVTLDQATADCPAGRWETNVTIPKNSVWRAAHGPS